MFVHDHYALRLTINRRSLEKLVHLFQVLCLWLPLPSLPTAKGAGVNPELSREEVLSHAKEMSN